MQSMWMLFAAFVFSVMGLCIKLASSMYSTSEIVMYRGGIGVVFMSALIIFSHETFRTQLPWHHLWRGILGVTAMWLWFYSIGKLPLATAMTLNYMSPIWIAAILFIAKIRHRKSSFEWGLVIAVTMSFIGVTLLLRPTIHADQWIAGVVALISGMLAALAYLQVRHLGQLGETESRVVFYLSVISAITGLVGTITDGGGLSDLAHTWHAHSGKGIILLLTIGISATVAQIAMTRAYRLGKTLVTANLQYTGIIFSSGWGIILWNDALSWSSWLGITIILFSGIAATYYNVRNSKSEVVSETDPILAEL